MEQAQPRQTSERSQKFPNIPFDDWVITGKTWDGHYVFKYQSDDRFAIWTLGKLGMPSPSFPLTVVKSSNNIS